MRLVLVASATGLGISGTAAAQTSSPQPFSGKKSKLTITGVRLVQTRPRRPVTSYTPASGSWSTGGVEVANPMWIYAEYKAKRSLFQPNPGDLDGWTVEIVTDKGVKGYGSGGSAVPDRSLSVPSECAKICVMARVNLTLDEETFRELDRHTKRVGKPRATVARELVREALASRTAAERRRRLAADYAAGRADARAALKDLESAQLELMDDEEA
ncbi:MAG: CopG family transcriptional regulator [Acidobacteria bacterium]|nr:CopG family transcriptional regulator [Acidobacteriota bacterium]